MKKLWKNYRSTILLLIGVLVGCIVGLVWKEDAAVLSPLGDLFLNMMFVIIVPLIFLTLTTSIAKIKQPKRLTKVLVSVVGVFVFMSLISCAVGLVSTYVSPLVDSNNSAILEGLSEETESSEIELNLLERTVSLISVSDFNQLLTKSNIIALVVFSIIVGIAISKVGEAGEPFLKVLESCNTVILKVIDIFYQYAPIGLGCYFASLVGTYGASIAVGYLKTFLIYLVATLFTYFALYTLYAYLAGGKKGVKAFWSHIIPSTVTSISTCSSAACIPINVKTAKEIGVDADVAETTIPLGTSFHKDGSVIGSVFKIMFLAYLFGTDVTSVGGIFQVIGVALLANLLVTAVPIGGGTISEMLIITLMGYPLASLPILTLIATIIDAPATLLNATGDVASSMLVARITDGKDWMEKKSFQTKVKETVQTVKENVAKKVTNKRK